MNPVVIEALQQKLRSRERWQWAKSLTNALYWTMLGVFWGGVLFGGTSFNALGFFFLVLAVMIADIGVSRKSESVDIEALQAVAKLKAGE